MICCQNNSGFPLVTGLLLVVSAYVANAIPTPASVFSSSQECSKIGLNLLNNGGSAVDAAITTILCDGLVSSQGFAIGGGFVMKLWDSQAKQGSILTAKEQPPAASKRSGAKAIEVPGDVAGFWEVHQKHGKLPWAKLFDDVLALADTKDSGLKLASPKLAETLKKIRDNGKDIFYSGEIAEKLVKEIQAAGGITTLEDFKNYQPQWQNSLTLPGKVDVKEKNDLDLPHAAVVGLDGFCVTVTSTNKAIPQPSFESQSTGVILKEC